MRPSSPMSGLGWPPRRCSSPSPLLRFGPGSPESQWTQHQTLDRPLEDFAIAVRCYSISALASLCGLAVLFRQVPFRWSRDSARSRRALLAAFTAVAVAWIVPPLLIDRQRAGIVHDPSYWVQVVVVMWCCGFGFSQGWMPKPAATARKPRADV